MTTSKHDDALLYKTGWCSQSMMVEHFLKRNNVPTVMIDIDKDLEAKQELIELNGGYASVPTLVLPDGSKLTEPSISELRNKLNLAQGPGLIHKVRNILGGAGRRNE
jgi:mycoredoxin